MDQGTLRKTPLPSQDPGDPLQDFAACRTGFVAAKNGVASSQIMQFGIAAVETTEHGGGVAADGQTSDGVGVTVQVDQDFFKEKYRRRGPVGVFEDTQGNAIDREIAVGTIFFPRDHGKVFDRCCEIINEELGTYAEYARLREPPIHDAHLGPLARNSHPRIFQLLIPQADGVTKEQMDIDLYLVKRRILKRINDETIVINGQEQKLSGEGRNKFYIPSLSRHQMVYKSLALAHKLKDVYSDLKDKTYKTAWMIFHRRFSTNTAPTWERAHPNPSGLAHNGEINSLQTNIEMFHRIERVFLPLYGKHKSRDLMNALQEGGTDSAMLSDAIEFLQHAGLSPPTIKSLLVPEAVMPGSELTPELKKMYQFIDVLIGPWDGPNTMVFPGKDMVLIGGDRNGLRPARYVILKNGIVYTGSEDGVLQDIPDSEVLERGNLEPGEMLAINFKEGRIMRDAELKTMAARELQEKFNYHEQLDSIADLEEIPASQRDYKWTRNEEILRHRQRLGNHSQETIEYLDSLAEFGKDPLGSMGDDAALTISSRVYRSFQNFFQQKFAQVTNPPLDTIRERAVMSLKTYLGFLYDDEGHKGTRTVHRLKSPILTNATFESLRRKIGEDNIVEIDCSFPASGNKNALKTALNRIRREAEKAARDGKHIILTDEYVSEARAGIPMLLATGAINTNLIKKHLRGQTSINVRSAESYEGHDFAAFIGLGGADTVNAYMAEETIAARHRLGIYKFEDETSAFNHKTRLGEFSALYANTGDPELDREKRTKINGLGKSYQKFLENYKDLALEDLAKHEDPDVRRQLNKLMKKLDVSVHQVFGKKSLNHVIDNWKTASENALLKIMGKMGISHIASYRGGRLFEALGIGQDVIDECFPGVPTPIGGLSLAQIQQRELQHHQKVFDTDPELPLEHKGRYKFRMGEDTEAHIITAELIDMFQGAVGEITFEAGYKKYRAYAEKLKARCEEYRFGVRDWMDFKKGQKAVDISEVEDRSHIVARFFTGAMSAGSLSPAAHEMLALASSLYEKIHGRTFRSNSGEGGEDPARYGTDKSSKIKQMASARFGVDLDYLLDAGEIQIKVAQGAKPGEGGELDGLKVGLYVSRLRHCEPGTTLISPPPHHDIYSIEDLEQLIYDIKQINPKARVNVKLVASTGVDVISSGCAKAGADTVHISGYNGGTGASPQGSIPHAGMPWEIFARQINETLSSQGFRERIKVTADGGMRMGRDIVIAALLGAEEYGFGLQALIAEGCKLVRTCQNGKCPFHIAGEEGEFKGTPEMIMNMMDFIAEDTREILAELGLKSIDEAIGRTDLLEQAWGRDLGINLDKIIPDQTPEQIAALQKCELKDGERNERINPEDPDKISLDQQILDAHESEILGDILIRDHHFTYNGTINNEDRTFGARISATLRQTIIDRLGRNTKVKDDTVKLNLKGVAGQSLGFGLMEGITINLEGAANDGVGKSLSGGKIIIRPDPASPIAGCTQRNIILGNAALYGAIKGKLYAAGRAGNRFAMRLSGAETVVEGAGANACNYMTAGTAVILGDVGQNFGAGMKGGEAFVYDVNNKLEKRTYDKDTRKSISTIADDGTKQRLKKMVRDHFNATGSQHSKSMLNDWDSAVKHFKHVSVAPPKKLKQPQVRAMAAGASAGTSPSIPGPEI